MAASATMTSTPAKATIDAITARLRELFTAFALLLVLGAIARFTGFSILCGFAGDLTTMIIGRAGQGITAGALIPTAMTIVATRLHARHVNIQTTPLDFS